MNLTLNKSGKDKYWLYNTMLNSFYNNYYIEGFYGVIRNYNGAHITLYLELGYGYSHKKHFN